MENPPEVVNCLPGSRFTLFAPNLCSLEIGSPVYYRRIEVGHVIGYDLDPNGDQVNIQVFIDATNDKFVTQDTRFWDVSGFNLTLSADGFNVETGSLRSEEHRSELQSLMRISYAVLFLKKQDIKNQQRTLK